MITRGDVDSVGYYLHNPDFNKGRRLGITGLDWQGQWDYLLVPDDKFYRPNSAIDVI
jgi:hypothetical protein